MNNKKTIYVVCLLLLVTVMTIGYALIEGTLNINGSTKVKATSWDIYFDNINVTTGSVTENEDTKIDQNDKTKVTFNVDLASPGDFYEFTVDIKNDGNIDAMIESYTITPELTSDQQKYLTYEVKYANDAVVGVNDILEKNSTRTMKVKVEYKKDIESTDLNKNDETLSLAFEVTYIQATSEAHEPVIVLLPNWLTSYSWIDQVEGNGGNIGDEVAIGNEHFYVVKNDGDKAVLLSKYNLLVGSTCSSSSCTQLTNPTGIQDETAIGYHYASGTITPEYPAIGIVPFSSTNYWMNGNSYLLKTEYGEDYPAYVYNDNASIKTYVDNYKNYLENFGANIIQARLISYDELVELGCTTTASSCMDNGAPSWVYSTSYWTGTADSNFFVYYVSIDGSIAGYSYNNDNYRGRGVRPVIVISSDTI